MNLTSKIKNLIITLSVFIFVLVPHQAQAGVVLANTVRNGTSEVKGGDYVPVQSALEFTTSTTIYAIILWPTSSNGSSTPCIDSSGGVHLAPSLGRPDIMNGGVWGATDYSPSFGYWAYNYSGNGGTTGTGSSTPTASGGCLFTLNNGFTIPANTPFDLYPNSFYGNGLETSQGYAGSVSDLVIGEAGHGHRLTGMWTGEDTNIEDFAFVLCDTLTCSDTDQSILATKTRINATSPIDDENIGTSTTVNLEGEYYLNSLTNVEEEDIPTSIKFTIYNTLFAGEQKVIILPITAQFDNITTFATTTILDSNKRYMWTVALEYNSADTPCQNSNLASVFCAFERLKTNNIASDVKGNTFIIGNDPRENLENFAQSIFGTVTGITEAPSLFGECSFVATSTCDVLSPSTYMGCLMNVLIVAFCPTPSVINYATSTLMGSMSNKVPFGYFYDISQKIDQITGSTTPVIGSNVNVNIQALGNGTTTMFSWQEAHDFMYDVIPDFAITIFKYVAWLLLCAFAVRLIFRHT